MYLLYKSIKSKQSITSLWFFWTISDCTDSDARSFSWIMINEHILLLNSSYARVLLDNIVRSKKCNRFVWTLLIKTEHSLLISVLSASTKGRSHCYASLHPGFTSIRQFLMHWSKAWNSAFHRKGKNRLLWRPKVGNMKFSFNYSTPSGYSFFFLCEPLFT